MKKTVMILSALLVLASCSSSQKKVSDKGDDESTSAEVVAPLQPPEKVEAKSSEKTAPPTSSPVAPKDSRASSTALDDAIKAQSDERIFKTATEALLQNPGDEKALNALALFYYKKGRFTLAKHFLGKAIQTKPSSEFYNNLGVVNLALGENREAVLAFRQGFALNPQDGVIAANLGAILVDQRDYNKAIIALGAAYKTGVRDFKTLNNYAIALTATGRGSQAVQLYEKALKDQANNRDLLFNYSILLIENLKRFKDGNEILNRLKFVGGTTEQRARIKDLENKVKLGLQ
jgi:Flp pilus assembly protein TadD